MSRLSIDLTPEQHKAIKAKASLEGMAIKDFILERVFTKKSAKPLAKDEPCPLCEAYGGKHRKFNKRTEKALKESMKEIKEGKLKSYRTAEEMFRDLGL